MADSDSRSPLAQLNDDMTPKQLQELAQKLVTQVKGPFDSDIEARCALAILRAQMGQLEEARVLLEEARLIAPTNLISYNLRIQLESQAGPPGEGDRWMRRHARIEAAGVRGAALTDADVQSIEQRIKKVQARGGLIDIADIIEDFIFGDSIQPGLKPVVLADLYHRLGGYLVGLGEHEDAWRCFSTAVVLDPGNPVIVATFLKSYPDNPDTYLIPDPSPEAYGLQADADGQHASDALASAGITVAQLRENRKRTALVSVKNKTVLDLGGAFPPAFTQLSGAKSWLSLCPDVEPEEDGAFKLNTLDLSELEEDTYDVVFLHGLATKRPGIAIEAAARSLKKGGKILILLGPAWTSAWGHNKGLLGKEQPIPDWSHLIWGTAEYRLFARTAGVDVANLISPPRETTPKSMLVALNNPSLKVKALKVVRRSFPLPHIRQMITQTHPSIDNVYDWGYEVILKKE